MWLKNILFCCDGLSCRFNPSVEVRILVSFYVLKEVQPHRTQPFFSFLILGQLARQVYESMRREASSIRIQKDLRKHLARKAYNQLCSSAVSVQTGMRGMAARNELRFRRQTRAAIIIQVQ